MEHLVVIDGHHMMYRAYWAIPRTLKTSAGQQVNAVFGMASMLLSILSAEQPDALVVCFDEGEETFRHQENETYKDGRAETPDDFYEQIPAIIDLVDTFTFKHVSNPQYEADDFIATYATAGEAAGMRVTVVSGDRDVLQLASEHVRVAIPHKGYQAAEYLGPVEIEEKYGIRPDQVAAYKGLCGDSSDNLPGVMGIGPKTAAKLLQQYDTLPGIYDHLSEIKGTVATKLETDREQAFFCERMAELERHIDLPFALPELALQELAPAPIFTQFSALEFSLLTKRLQALLESEYGQAHFVYEQDAQPLPEDTKSQLTLF